MAAAGATMRSRLARGLLVLVLSAAIPLQAAPAGETPKSKPADSREKAAIHAILADPVFGGEKEETEWRYTGAPADDAKLPEGDSSWFKAIGDAIEFVGSILRYLVWIAMVALVSALVYLSYRHRHAWLGRFGGRAAPPSFLFGLDVRPESLPDDVAAAALLALGRGDAAGALSLLYRGALVSLIHRSQLDFHAGHTEDDCLRLARGAVDAGSSGYFAELLQAWKLTAYAHEAPPAPVLEALCLRWRAHFSQVGGSR